MNKDQIKGTAHSLAGKLQSAAGKAIGSREQERKGLQKQVLGSAEIAIGEAKRGVKPVNIATRRTSVR